MHRVFLYLAYAIALTGLGIFVAAQVLPQEKAGPALAVSLPLTMIAGLVIRYLQKRSNDT
ncbi:MAG: hypothetical protein ABJ327_04185 [Litoreibacter sp.]